MEDKRFDLWIFFNLNDIYAEWISVVGFPCRSAGISQKTDDFFIAPFKIRPGEMTTPLKFNSSPLKNDGQGKRLPFLFSMELEVIELPPVISHLAMAKNHHLPGFSITNLKSVVGKSMGVFLWFREVVVGVIYITKMKF